jgi:rhodanese-related sulfurtransferase
MLEFWVDPDSPYFKSEFGATKTFVFFCQSGWRSALATKAVQDMGLAPVAHIEGGFRGWVDSGQTTRAVAAKAKQ